MIFYATQIVSLNKRELDDLKAYFSEEIVVFAELQNRGYGAALMEEPEMIGKHFDRQPE